MNYDAKTDNLSINILSMEELYNKYKNNTETTNVIKILSDKIISVNNNISKYTEILSLIISHTNTYDELFTKFIDDVFYHINEHNINNSVIFFKSMLKIIQKLHITLKHRITKFLFSVKNILVLICYYPQSQCGHSYMNESIFLSLFPIDDSMLLNMDKCIDTISPLYSLCFDDSIDYKIVRGISAYINDIFKKNIGYTYENQNMINKDIMSRIDLCILCFIVITEIMKNINDKNIYNKNINNKTKNTTSLTTLYNEIEEIFWNGIFVVYITTNIMEKSINDNILISKQQLEELKELGQISQLEELERKEFLEKGEKMLDRLSSYVSCIDTKFVDEYIYNIHVTDIANNIHAKTTNYYLVKNKRFDILNRLINDIGNTSLIDLAKRSGFGRTIDGIKEILVNFIISIFDTCIPNHIKYDLMRLIISHDLKNELLKTDNLFLSMPMMVSYLTNINILDDKHCIHITDIISEFSETEFMKNHDVIDFLLHICPNIAETYKNIVKILFYESVHASRENKKINVQNMKYITTDMKKIYLFTINIAENISIIAVNNNNNNKNNILSYIGGFLELINIIKHTNDLMKTCIDNNSNNKKVKYITSLGENMGKIYCTDILPYIDDFIRKLSPLYITNDVADILYNIHGIDVITKYPESKIKIVDITKNIPPTIILDSISYDIIYTPYLIPVKHELYQFLSEYINSSSDKNSISINESDRLSIYDLCSYHIVDRKTFYEIKRTEINPFNRQYLNNIILEEINNLDFIMNMKNSIKEEIDRYLDLF